MGIAQYFSEWKKRRLLRKVEVAPGVWLPAALREYWPRIAKTRMNSIRIKAIPIDDPSPMRSGFGCYPILPKGYAYPKDANGEYLFPLAQICCSDMPSLAGYPSTGYLQFYIGCEDFGVDFKNPVSQLNFRVLYFEDEEVSVRETDFSFLEAVMASDESPVSKPHSLAFSLRDDYLGVGEVREQEYPEILAELEKRYPDLAEELDNEICKEFACIDHKIGGYAYFTQTDPREGEELYKNWLLLFQMDSDDKIMWGDVGVANFFIAPEDLARRDFTKVFYTWDCC